MKADLARYCIVNSKGGFYIDVGLRAEARVVPDSRINLVAFRDIGKYTYSNYACANGFFYSTPDSPVLETAIDMILQNVEHRFYGVTPLCPTGPGLFGRAIALEHKDGSFMFGDCMELTPTQDVRNKAFVMPNGTVVLRCKPAHGGDLTALGARGTNNYNEVWQSKNVYGELIGL